jgi:hypothetical protein
MSRTFRQQLKQSTAAAAAAASVEVVGQAYITYEEGNKTEYERKKIRLKSPTLLDLEIKAVASALSEAPVPVAAPG